MKSGLLNTPLTLSGSATVRAARLHRIAGFIAGLLLCSASSVASAQLLSKTLAATTNTLQQTTTTVVQTTNQVTQTVVATLPVSATASGNHAEIKVGIAALPLLEVILDFEDANGLTPASLGATAQLVHLTDSALLGRLPELNLTPITDVLKVLVTIEPPANGGLSFRGTGRLEIHTHLLPYSIGSSLRVFKAPLLGQFVDVTDEIAEGSVRARTTYGGFSQFLILIDLRPTSAVIDEKVGRLRARIDALPLGERAPLSVLVDDTEAALDVEDYAAALSALDAFRTRVQSRAGTFIPDEWRASGGVENQAGLLIADINTLKFSVAYLRDFGQ